MIITAKNDLLSDSMEAIVYTLTRVFQKLSECDFFDCAVENMDIWAILIVVLAGIISYCCPKNLLMSSKFWRKLEKNDKKNT